MTILDKIKARLQNQSKTKEDDEMLIELSDFIDSVFDDLGNKQESPEAMPNKIKVYDEAINLLQQYLDYQKKVTKSWMNVLESVQKSASFHRDACDHAKQIFKIK